MDPETAEEHPSAAKSMDDAKAEQVDEHERDVEDREAFEAWGGGGGGGCALRLGSVDIVMWRDMEVWEGVSR